MRLLSQQLRFAIFIPSLHLTMIGKHFFLFSDYSCALQKEILVHGRLYITQNYLCFYANIFRWETTVTLLWKDVTAITKEKTALVIPNAILLCDRNDKYFFTSFSSRDKTFMMLFRVWQNALLDQPMTQQEMWQWVCFLIPHLLYCFINLIYNLKPFSFNVQELSKTI